MKVDWMLVVFELINFGVVVLLLNRFVFRPVQRTLERRHADMVEREQQTHAREQAAAQLRERYEAELGRLEQLAKQRVDAALDEARETAEAIIAEGRKHVRELVEHVERELALGRRRALEHFRVEVLTFAVQAAGRLLRELGAVEVGQAFVRRAIHALEDAIGNGPIAGRVEVFVSPELDPEGIEAMLREAMPNIQHFHVTRDDELIGGVRIAAGGCEIESSAGHSLDAWYRSLTADEERIPEPA